VQGSSLSVSRPSRLNLLNITRSLISDSSAIIQVRTDQSEEFFSSQFVYDRFEQRFRIMDNASLEIKRSSVVFGDSVVYGSIAATQTELVWSEDLLFEAGSALSVRKNSRMFVNGTVGFRQGCQFRIAEETVFEAIASFLTIRAATMLVDLDSTVRLLGNGSINIRGCNDFTPESLSTFPLGSRPCSLFVRGGSTLQTDESGSVVILENGLFSALNSASVGISNNLICFDGAVSVGDNSSFSSYGNVRILPGCAFRAFNLSQIVVVDGVTTIFDSLLNVDQSNCAFHRTVCTHRHAFLTLILSAIKLMC
jgi:hypothetical protein